MNKYVERLRGLTIAELCDERGFLPGGTQQDDELDNELARRDQVWGDLLAGAEQVFTNSDCIGLECCAPLYAALQRAKQ